MTRLVVRSDLAIAVALGAAIGAGVVASVSAVRPMFPPLAAACMAVAAVAFKWPIWVLCAAIVAVPLHDVSFTFGGQFGINPSEGLLILATLGWVVRRLARGEPIYQPSGMSAALLLLLAATAAGIVVAEHPTSVIKVLLVWVVLFVVLQMVIAEADATVVRNLLAAVVIAGAIGGAMAIVSGGGHVIELGLRARDRAAASFGSPNRLGELLALAIPIQLAIALRGPRKLRIPAWICLGVAAVGLTLTLSRAAFLGLALGLPLLLWWSPFRSFAAVAVPLALIVIAVGPGPLGGVVHADELAARIGSAQYTDENPRFLIYERTQAAIADHPLFGVGADNYPEAAAEYAIVDPRSGAVVPHAHNLPLHIVAERGLVGLGALLWFAVALAAATFKACRRQSGAQQAYSYGLAAGLAALAVTGLADYFLNSNEIAMVAVTLAGCAAALARPVAAAPDKWPVEPGAVEGNRWRRSPRRLPQAG